MPKRLVHVNNNGQQQMVLANDPVATPILTNPVVTSETVVARWQLPADFILAGHSIKAGAFYISGGTGTIIFRLRIGALGTVADSLAVQLATSAAQVLNGRSRCEFDIYASSSTLLNAAGFCIANNAVLGQLTGAVNNVTVVPTAPIFISITAQCSVAQSNVVPGACMYYEALQ
jgi:hypothetical protein